MTLHKKSKPVRLITAFLVGSGIGLHVQYASAQAVLSNDLRGTIDLPTGPQLPEQPRIQPPNENTGLRTPVPTAEEQRQQLIQTRNVQAGLQDQNRSPRQNLATQPVQTANTPAPETDDFAATGFRLGTFEATATLEQALGYSSNISGNSEGEGGGFSQTDVTLGLTSNWSRHELQINAAGTYQRPFDSEGIDRPSLNLDANLRLDLLDGYTLTTRGFYNVSTQDFTSTTLAPGAIDNPIQQGYGGSVELQRTDRKLQLTLRGSIERNTFGDADLGGGITQSQEDRNSTDYGTSLRVGYEVSPAITPFAQVNYTMREFELETDRNGNQRDSDIMELRGGIEVDLGDKVQGEFAIGSVTESFDDPTLSDLSGFTLNGELNWSPSRETQVGLTLGTSTNSSITTNENGSILYNARLEYERQISARLSMDAFADLQVETNVDNNQTFTIGAGLDYWVNRHMAVTADIEYEQFSTDVTDAEFDALEGRIGIRLQR